MTPRVVALAAALAALAGPASAAAQFSPEAEQRNYSKIDERFEHESGKPAYQAMLRERGAQEDVELARIRVTDPERSSAGNLCSSHMDGCAGDVRLYSWETDGFGVRRPLTFVARNGGVLSGHLWYTRFGPPVRPAVVITTGSVQAPEQLYAFAATTLAKRGYVVLTYDVITQGRSDNRGEGPDAGYYQAQSPDAFSDGTQDALDFLLSTPATPYRPRFPARKLDGAALQQDHAPKQARRVAARLSAPFNPVSAMVDPTRIGIVGHSLGAFGVSRIASDDRRVKAVVAWDNLSVGGTSSFGPTAYIPPRVPALSMSNDYGLTPTPYTSAPDPRGRNAASLEFSRRGVDTMQVNTRGGTHYEYSYIPNPGFPATLRGMDMAAWYTSAWLDRYVKGDAGADARLLTTRWLDDARGKAVDPAGDGNLLSTYLLSRVDIGRGGGSRATCEDLRRGTPGCAALAADGCRVASYSYLAEAQTKDGAPAPETVSCPSRAVTTPSTRFAVRAGLSAPRLASDASASPTFPVAVRPPAGAAASLVDRYELQVRAGRGWRRLGVPRARFRGRAGRVHRFRARAIGRGGVAGPWRHASTVVPRDETALRRSAGWSRVRGRGAFLGRVLSSSRPGASASIAVRGSRFYVVGPRGPGGGTAAVLVDGRRVGTLRSRARRAATRRVLFTRAVSSRRAHRIAIRVLTGRVALDAFGHR